MKQRTCLALVALLATVHAPQGLSQGWASCRDRIFFGSDQTEEMREDYDLWIVLRVLGDCDRERQVTLVRDRDGKLEASVLKPRGKAISKQLDELKAHHPDKEPGELCQMVEVVEDSVDAKKQAELENLVRELESMQISPLFEPVIYIHGVSYEVWIGSSLDLSHFDFQGPPFTKADRKEGVHPLDSWSQRVLMAVGASCKMPER